MVEQSDLVFQDGDSVIINDGPEDVAFERGRQVFDAVGADSYVYEDGVPVPAGIVFVGELDTKTPVAFVGDEVRLQTRVFNYTSSSVDYTLEWKEDGSKFKSQTNTVGADSYFYYNIGVTKSSAGERIYQAADSNKLAVTWLNVRPKNFRATKYIVDPGKSTTLKLDVENPNSSSRTVDVSFRAVGGGTVGSSSKTISAGSTATFTASTSRSSEQKVSFVADVTVSNSGLSGTTRELAVVWTNGALTANGTEFQPVGVGDFATFYDYYDAEAHHPYEAFGETRVALLFNTTGFAVLVTHDDGTGGGNRIDATTTWDTTNNVMGAYVVEDDPRAGDDEYGDVEQFNVWARENTDGSVRILPDTTEVTVSVSSDTISGGKFVNTGASLPVTIKNTTGF